MNTYQLDILTPLGHVFTRDIHSLVVPAIDGSLGVMAKHSPMLVVLKPGVVKVADETGEHFFSIDTGVLEVSPDSKVSILVDEAVRCKNQEDAVKKVTIFKRRRHG